jgi:hypothetical protein
VRGRYWWSGESSASERYRRVREREECNDRRREEKVRICKEMKKGRG